jgi:hypothetical protein
MNKFEQGAKADRRYAAPAELFVTQEIIYCNMLHYEILCIIK